MEHEAIDWRAHGVRIVHGDQLDTNTPQTPGMDRAAAINYATAGAQKLWAGTVTIHPDAKTGAHHHGELESVIYVLSGRARMRWGDRLEYVAEAGPGDFIYVPPFVPHQEINASPDEVLQCVLVRSDQQPVVVNLDIAPVEDDYLVYNYNRFQACRFGLDGPLQAHHAMGGVDADLGTHQRGVRHQYRRDFSVDRRVGRGNARLGDRSGGILRRKGRWKPKRDGGE